MSFVYITKVILQRINNQCFWEFISSSAFRVCLHILVVYVAHIRQPGIPMSICYPGTLGVDV